MHGQPHIRVAVLLGYIYLLSLNFEFFELRNAPLYYFVCSFETQYSEYPDSLEPPFRCTPNPSCAPRIFLWRGGGGEAEPEAICNLLFIFKIMLYMLCK